MPINQDVAFRISADVTGQQAVDQLAASLKRLGTQGEMSSKQMAAAMRLVPAQLTDIATQLAGGQSPFLIMLQQGGQLRDMFGSVTGALAAVARTISGVLTPINMVAAALALVGVAAYKGAEESSQLQKQLLLTGGAAGFTADQIEKMARTLKDTQGIAATTARDLTTGLAGTGQLVGRNLELAAQAAAKLQRLSGQSSDEIVKDFARMGNGVAAWAAEHNKQFNYLSLAQFQHIKQLEEMGRKEDAIRENIAALNKVLDGRTRELGYIEQAWERVKKVAGDAWQAMLNVGKPESDGDKISRLRQQLASLESLATQPISGGAGDAARYEARRTLEQRRAEILEQIRLLQGGIDKANAEAAAKAKEEAETRRKIEEEQSGKANSARSAALQVELAQLQGAADKRIAVLEQEVQRIENKYRAGLITEEEYNAEKLRIAKATLNERMKLTEQEIALESRRPGSSDTDALQRQAKIQQLRNELAKLNASAIEAELKAEGDRAAFLRQMNDEVAKFSRTQAARIDQINMEAAASEMSTLQYRKHTEALRIDKEAADAAKGKAPEFVAAIMAEADAQKAATMAALDHADALKNSFSAGVRSAMKDYVENTANAASQAKDLFSNAFKGMEDALVNFVKTGKLDFKSLADSIISDLIRIQIRAAMTSAIGGGGGGGGILGGIVSAVGSFFGMGGGSGAASGGGYAGVPGNVTWGFANGGIMTAAGSLPLNAYAGGGVASKPQMALFGEGKTPEAYVPLPDGRHIPVAMQGSGGGANVVVNVVNNASNANATAHERQDTNGTRIIDVVVEQVKASIAADISRGVGTVTSALERTYGANRTAGAY